MPIDVSRMVPIADATMVQAYGIFLQQNNDEQRSAGVTIPKGWEFDLQDTTLINLREQLHSRDNAACLILMNSEPRQPDNWRELVAENMRRLIGVLKGHFHRVSIVLDVPERVEFWSKFYDSLLNIERKVWTQDKTLSTRNLYAPYIRGLGGEARGVSGSLNLDAAVYHIGQALPPISARGPSASQTQVGSMKRSFEGAGSAAGERQKKQAMGGKRSRSGASGRPNQRREIAPLMHIAPLMPPAKGGMASAPRDPRPESAKPVVASAGGQDEVSVKLVAECSRAWEEVANLRYKLGQADRPNLTQQVQAIVSQSLAFAVMPRIALLGNQMQALRGGAGPMYGEVTHQEQREEQPALASDGEEEEAVPSTSMGGEAATREEQRSSSEQGLQADLGLSEEEGLLS